MEFLHIINGENTMKIKDFFIFRANTNTVTFQAHPINLGSNKNGTYDADSLAIGNYEGINFPVIFKQAYGKKLLNILGTGWGTLYLISDKMKTILEENKLTGWKTFPIKLYDKKGKEIFGYHGFSITGHCGPIDYKKAEIIDRQRIPTGPIFKAYKGMHFGLDKWDGSDFFIPGKVLFFIITDKAATIIKTDKTLNASLINCEDFEIDVDIVAIKD